MSRRVRGQRNSRLMEKGVHELLVKYTAGGAPVAMAAEAVGVSERAFLYWLSRGRDEQERIDEAAANGQTYTPSEREKPYLALYRDIMHARAEAGVRNVGYVQKSAQGGYVTEETTRTLPDGTVEKTVKRAAPDWRAAAWYLERQQRHHFGKEAMQVELTGAGGGAVQIEGAPVEELTARITKNIAELTAAGTRHGNGEVIDAVVED